VARSFNCFGDTSTNHRRIVDLESNRIAQVQIGRYVIPTDEFGRFQVNYNGPRGTHQTVSMIDVMEGRTGPEALKDKIVIVGATALGLFDVVLTPFDSVLPGVEVHANVIDNILHQRYVLRSSLAKIIDITIILVFGLVLGYFLPQLNATRSLSRRQQRSQIPPRSQHRRGLWPKR